MDFMARLFGRIAYEFVLIQPLIPLYLHIILSALFTIFIGAHASLSRPSSAAEPNKAPKDADGDNDDEDTLQGQTELKMEGMSPLDALTLPLLAGSTLAGLYFLIKWLEDPALLNKILDYYFSIFGIFSVVLLLTDAMTVASSFAFPSAYSRAGKVWRADQKKTKMISLESSSAENPSPLPGWFSILQLPQGLSKQLWCLKKVLTAQLRVRLHVHKAFTASVQIRALSFMGFFIAIIAVGYYIVVDKPWWLTNFLGISFAYNALQIMSPTTFWTGTMILSGLFVYDIYFVFFTPLMVTVATKLEIPAKLLFPRPSRPGEDRPVQLAMLGLGDIVLPGIMIGLALRFDLYLFYLRKQSQLREAQAKLLEAKDDKDEVVKVEWVSATGSWGERFWIGCNDGTLSLKERAGVFTKTYFYASLVGYSIGMIVTLGVMHFYGHAQPALLYLVPGVLGAQWGTAFIKGDAKLMWEYSEAADEKEKKSLVSPSRVEEIAAKLAPVSSIVDVKRDSHSTKESNSERVKSEDLIHDDLKDQLVHFSITMPSARVQKARQRRSSKGERPNDIQTPARQPGSENELKPPSVEDAKIAELSTNLSSGGQENTAQIQEPPGKRQKLG